MEKEFVLNLMKNNNMITGYQEKLKSEDEEEAKKDYLHFLTIDCEIDTEYDDVDCEEIKYLIYTNDDNTSLYIEANLSCQDAFDYIENAGYDISEWEYIETEGVNEETYRTIFHIVK